MSITHEQALREFVDFLNKKGRSPSTIVAYKKDIEQLFDYFADKHSKVSDYKTDHVQVYIDTLIKEKKFTLKTISRKINSFKTLFKFLHNHKYTPSDVAHPVTHPRFKPKEPRILSSLEYKALRDTARSNPRLAAMIELLLQTGMRIGELSRIRIRDLDIADKTNGSVALVAFASNPPRIVPLNEDCVVSIQKYIKSRVPYRSDDEFLFITKNGNQVLIRNMRTMINNMFVKAGIDDATVNDIRNTFIVYQLEHGIPLERVAEIVGHQRLTSTEKYLNLVKSRKKAKSGKVIAL